MVNSVKSLCKVQVDSINLHSVIQHLTNFVQDFKTSRLQEAVRWLISLLENHAVGCKAGQRCLQLVDCIHNVP